MRTLVVGACTVLIVGLISESVLTLSDWPITIVLVLTLPVGLVTMPIADLAGIMTGGLVLGVGGPEGLSDAVSAITFVAVWASSAVVNALLLGWAAQRLSGLMGWRRVYVGRR